MKKILFLLLTYCFFDLSAQTVNDIPLSEIDVDYIQILGTSKTFSRKITVEIDFGQEDKAFNSNDTKLIDSDGKRLIFNSMIDALNFFSKNGFEFVDAYAITIDNKNVYHYLLRKKN